DLYYRISGFTFDLPPLSARRDDIEVLVKHFQKLSSRRYIVRPEAMELLKRYNWPGNVRELSKVCERLSQSSNGIVDVDSVRPQLVSQLPENTNESEWKEHVFS